MNGLDKGVPDGPIHARYLARGGWKGRVLGGMACAGGFDMDGFKKDGHLKG